MQHALRFALRSIWRSKLFALTALVAFSFGIGATATIFSVIDAVLLRPATFPDAGSVVTLQASEKNRDWDSVAPQAYDRIRSRRDLFSQVAGDRMAIFTVTRVPSPDQVFGLSVSGNYFGMVGARPWMGRLLLTEDDRPGAPAVALLSYKAWRQLFAGDPNVVGKTAAIDGELHTIIGIMPSGFVVPGSKGSLWTALRLTPAELASPDARRMHVIARLQPSVTLSQAQNGLNALSIADVRFRALQWRDEADSTHKQILWLAMSMVCGLLILACANICSILMARAIARRRDYAIRLASGASRLRLIGESLLEVCVLAFGALLIACPAASIALHLIRDSLNTAQIGIPNLARIQLNSFGLLFSFCVALVAALLAGLFPALSATSIDLAAGLRETGTRATGSRAARRFLHSLVALEAGVSMLLLLTSLLLVGSLVRLMSDDHGLRPDHVLTLRLPTGSWQGGPPAKDQQRRIQRYLELLREAQTIRGVQAAALASSLPLSHTVVRTSLYATKQSASLDTREPMPIGQAVTGDYFRAMGIPILAGRTFETQDASSKPLALVNQALARTYFSGEDPVGKFLFSPHNKDSTQIIGVVRDSPHLDFAETAEPEVYLDFEQTSLTPFLTGMVVRTRDDPQRLSKVLAATLSLKDAEQAVVQVRTLRSLIDENVWQPRFSAWLFSIFAAFSLCLAGLGIYGVVAYVTTSRQRDFGIRVALGASPGGLFRLATWQSLRPVLLGIGLGVLGSYWTSRWVESLLYKTSLLDAGAILASAGILLLMALAATVGPAVRAAKVDPTVMLRSE